MLEKIKSNVDNNVVENSGKDNSGVGYDSITNINKEMQSNKEMIAKTN